MDITPEMSRILRFLFVIVISPAVSVIVINFPVVCFDREKKRFLKHDYFCFTFSKITFLLFKDSSGNKQMTTAIIATRKVAYLIL